MSKKDHRTADQIGAWYDATHHAQAMRLRGVPDRTIARKLNDMGYVTERLKPWSGNAVKRLLLQEPPHEPRRIEQQPITPENPKRLAVERYRDGKSGGAQIKEPRIEVTYETFTSEAEYQAFRDAAKAGAEAYRADWERRNQRPQDWGSLGSLSYLTINMQHYYGHLELAGKDTWWRSIMPWWWSRRTTRESRSLTCWTR